MLQNLHIQNYALIENLDISFDSGFSVITGETGAGKSILLGALALVLGGRADSAVISPGAKRCNVEATFETHSDDIARFMEQHDLDYDDGLCILRRELTSAGKSRAFINDTPVSLAIVRELSSRLIDVHSQHQNLLLNSNRFVVDVVDSVAGDNTLLKTYAKQYQSYKDAEKQLRELETQLNNQADNASFLEFQRKELSSASLEEGEQESLEEEQLILGNAETIKDAVYTASNNTSECLDMLHSSRNALGRITNVYPSVAELAERIESCNIELDDIQSELNQKLSDIDFDPQRASQVDDRLNTIYALQKKFHKKSVGELIDMLNDIESQLQLITHSDQALEEKQAQCAKFKQQATHTAQQLSDKRHKAAKQIETSMVAQLQALGMPDVRFDVSINNTPDITPSGMDDITFLFSSNKNMPVANINKIASGGEMARVMLSLKALLTAHKELPTIIFDEIDTGVSGKISDKMANVMTDMAQHGRQVVCITHQPQIAAAGQHHYRVYKESTSGQAHTHIEQLSDAERINEVAKMLSGETLTEAAISNAKNLLGL